MRNQAGETGVVEQSDCTIMAKTPLECRACGPVLNLSGGGRTAPLHLCSQQAAHSETVALGFSAMHWQTDQEGATEPGHCGNIRALNSIGAPGVGLPCLDWGFHPQFQRNRESFQV
jgi:hypothetical protein